MENKQLSINILKFGLIALVLYQLGQAFFNYYFILSHQFLIKSMILFFAVLVSGIFIIGLNLIPQEASSNKEIAPFQFNIYEKTCFLVFWILLFPKYMNLTYLLQDKLNLLINFLILLVIFPFILYFSHKKILKLSQTETFIVTIGLILISDIKFFYEFNYTELMLSLSLAAIVFLIFLPSSPVSKLAETKFKFEISENSGLLFAMCLILLTDIFFNINQDFIFSVYIFSLIFLSIFPYSYNILEQIFEEKLDRKTKISYFIFALTVYVFIANFFNNIYQIKVDKYYFQTFKTIYYKILADSYKYDDVINIKIIKNPLILKSNYYRSSLYIARDEYLLVLFKLENLNYPQPKNQEIQNLYKEIYEKTNLAYTTKAQAIVNLNNYIETGNKAYLNDAEYLWVYANSIKKRIISYMGQADNLLIDSSDKSTNLYGKAVNRITNNKE